MRFLPVDGNQSRNKKETTRETDIHDFVYKDDAARVKTCLYGSPDMVNMQNTRGQTPLMVAASFNRIQILDLLLTSQCDVMAKDNDGNTALHEAVDKGNTEIVRKIVSFDKDCVNSRNHQGETPLMKAAFYDYADIAKILLKEGEAKIDAIDNHKQSALLIGLREGSHVTVDLLLRHGCDVTLTNDLGQTALYIAIYSPCNKTLDLARKLINAGYDISSDKMWLLNEEKHNLFYQDDEFYSVLRRKLRTNSNDHSLVQNPAFHLRALSHSHSLSSDDEINMVTSPVKYTSPPGSPFAMSPTLKQKIMSSESPKFPSSPFTKLSSTESTDSSSSTSSLVRRHSDVKNSSRVRQSRFTKSFSSDSADTGRELSAPEELLATHSRQRDTCLVRCQSLREQSKTVQPFKESNNIPELINVPKNLEGTQSPNDHPEDKIIIPLKKTQSSVRHRKIATTSEIPLSSILKSQRNTNNITVLNVKRSEAPSVSYTRQSSVQQVSLKASTEKENITRKVSLPTRPSVHFSAEIQVFEDGRIH